MQESPLPVVEPTSAQRPPALGDYPAADRDLVLSRCLSYRRFVDVGAHFGVHVRAFAPTFVDCDAFEPRPKVAELLKANVSGSGATVHRAGLSRSAGAGVLAEALPPSAGEGQKGERREKGKREIYPLRTLDEFGWDDVDLLRIGFGPGAAEVLAGGLATIRRSLPLIWLAAELDGDLEVALALGRLGYRGVVRLSDGALLVACRGKAVPLTARDLQLEDVSLGDRFLHVGPGSPSEPPVRMVALDGRLHTAETVGFGGDAGRGELWSARMAPGMGSVSRVLRHGVERVVTGEAIVSLDAVLQRARASFRRGAFRLSLPVEALAYFREALIAFPSSSGETVIARRDLLQVRTLDDIEIRPPISLLTKNLQRMVVRLRTISGEERGLDLSVQVVPSEFTGEQITCYLNPGGGGNAVVNAFAASLNARRAYAEDGARDGAAIVWGVLRGSKDVIDVVQARGGSFYYIDHAYFARGHLRSYRVTRDRFEAGPIRLCPTDRLDALGVELQPWRTGGRYVLVCPPTDYFMQAHGCHDWLDNTLASLRAHTDREIVVRTKPQPGETIVPLAEAMAGAHALVTHSSNVAVEAVVAGTPVFVASSSAAAPVGETDLSRIEAPVRPERSLWLAHLSYSQFAFEEVKSGEAWRLLREYEARPCVQAGQEG